MVNRHWTCPRSAAKLSDPLADLLGAEIVDPERVHWKVPGPEVEGTLRSAGALHRRVPVARRTDADGDRPQGRSLLLRARHRQGPRRGRAGGSVATSLLRLVVQ